jgi:hypothetical protein
LCLSAMVPAFAEPDIYLLSRTPWGLHRRLSLGSLPVPKQPDGASGVNSVAQSANLRDLAACAPWNPDIFFSSTAAGYAATVLLSSEEMKSVPGDRRPADSSPSSGLRPELHDWHFLSAAPVHAAEPAPGSHGGATFAASTSTRCRCLLRCLESGVHITLSAELFSAPHSPQ